MANNRGQFQKGQSGNPKGRPKKERTLSRMLENGGKSRVGPKGETAQRMMVQRVWEGITQGMIRFPDLPDGTPNFIALDAAEWTRLAKLVYDQVDGPPKAELDVTSAGEKLPVIFQIVEGVPSNAARKDTSDGEDEDDDL